ncbi:MAG: 50S ribosomal protein L18 [Patescibacteria group bacterium]|nr:50S ribosomal protein L18 [Patescibacteria group bacterium]MBU1160636.1 50S ribosomal protein L18 [Patescibacteria group bacterium]MBU1349986.1 50S ribosomal protein L18 [Patescibacteria group bacterium]MBU1421443.1 50S ribosomal protein L18 [Patescibacteria group bacterium]MBU1684172.1 50S ribosomal protein L18 [Patescibacteria group bacterium]
MRDKQQQRNRRHNKVRAKIQGTAKRPRLNVFRSNVGMYVQLIDDIAGKTLASAHSKEIVMEDGKNGKNEKNKKSEEKNNNKKNNKNKTEISFELGKLLAKKALDKKIKTVIFDRGGYKYHGRVKAVAEGAREGGLRL